MPKNDDWVFLLDDRKTESPEEIRRLEKDLPPISAERKQVAELQMNLIRAKYFEENADDTTL